MSKDQSSNKLSTERLDLHLADLNDPSDVDKILAIYSDPFMEPSGFRLAGINTRQDVINKCKRHGPKRRHCKDPPASIYHLAHLKSTGEYIGLINMNFRDEFPFPDLGYALFEQFNGQGLATEASKEALRFWQDDIGVLKVSIATYDTNARSQRCAERIGFIHGGPFTIDTGDGVTRVGRAYILPGMIWPDQVTMRPKINTKD